MGFFNKRKKEKEMANAFNAYGHTMNDADPSKRPSLRETKQMMASETKKENILNQLSTLKTKLLHDGKYDEILDSLLIPMILKLEQMDDGTIDVTKAALSSVDGFILASIKYVNQFYNYGNLTEIRKWVIRIGKYIDIRENCPAFYANEDYYKAVLERDRLESAIAMVTSDLTALEKETEELKKSWDSTTSNIEKETIARRFEEAQQEYNSLSDQIDVYTEQKKLQEKTIKSIQTQLTQTNDNQIDIEGNAIVGMDYKRQSDAISGVVDRLNDKFDNQTPKVRSSKMVIKDETANNFNSKELKKPDFTLKRTR